MYDPKIHGAECYIKLNIFTMAGTILENLSGRKLAYLVSTLLICQIICFLIGGLIGKYTVFTSMDHSVILFILMII